MRIDMTTREWHELVRPVLPHALNDKDFPSLAHIRVELGAKALYAVASDRYTLGAERHVLPMQERHQPMPPVHVHAADIGATLKLFTFSKDDDPMLRVTIDTVPVRAEITGTEARWSSLGITLESEDGQRIIVSDRRIPDRDHLGHWHGSLRAALRRPAGALLDGLPLGAAYLARWKSAVRGGEVMRVYTGQKASDAVLITVERHFAGLWMPPIHIDAQSVAGLPWLAEIDDETVDLRTASGLLVNPGTGEAAAGDGDGEDGEP